MDPTTEPAAPVRRDPSAEYRERASHFRAKREDEERRYRGVAFLRVVVFLASAALVVVPLWRGLAVTNPVVVAGVAGFLLFGILVRRHNRIEDRMLWFGELVDVNEEAVR